MTRQRPGRGSGTAALIAVLVLLCQALVPAAAVAASTRTADLVLPMCSETGHKSITVKVPVRPHHPMGLACADCVMASFAAVAPAPVAVRAPVRVAVAAWSGPSVEGPRLSRAPPAPRSRGPPPTA